MKTSKRTAGFTLLEVILVISIMGVLSTLAIPNIAGQMQMANRNQRRTDAIELARTLNSYISISGNMPNSANFRAEARIYIADIQNNPTKYGITLPIPRDDPDFSKAIANLDWEEDAVGADDGEHYAINRFTILSTITV